MVWFTGTCTDSMREDIIKVEGKWGKSRLYFVSQHAWKKSGNMLLFFQMKNTYAAMANEFNIVYMQRQWCQHQLQYWKAVPEVWTNVITAIGLCTGRTAACEKNLLWNKVDLLWLYLLVCLKKPKKQQLRFSISLCLAVCRTRRQKLSRSGFTGCHQHYISCINFGDLRHKLKMVMDVSLTIV